MKKEQEISSHPKKTECQCFIFIGEDDFLLNKEANSIISKLLGNEDKTLSLEIIDANSKNAAELAEALTKTIKSLSMAKSLLTRKKIVWLRNATFLGEENLMKRETIKQGLQKLADLLSEGLSVDYFLLITAPAIDKRISFYKTLEKNSSIWLQPTPKPWEIRHEAINFLNKSLAENKLATDEETMELIVERVGYHPAIINNEITKISTYLTSETEKKFLTKDIAEQLVPSYSDTAIWDFIDALSSKDLIKAILLLRNLLFKNEEPIAIITMLENRFRQLMVIKSALATSKIRLLQKSSRFDNSFPFAGDREYLDMMMQVLAGEKGRILTPYALRRLAEESERFSLDELNNALEFILKTRRAVVSSSLPPQIHLELMTISICA